MNSLNETAPETAASRERVSQLSAAILRISASLDQATVLQEAVASARALTGARYGLIATVDEAGEVGDLVSSGLTPEEHRGLVDWPHGPELFAHLRDLPGPLRLDDTAPVAAMHAIIPWPSRAQKTSLNTCRASSTATTRDACTRRADETCSQGGDPTRDRGSRGRIASTSDLARSGVDHTPP